MFKIKTFSLLFSSFNRNNLLNIKKISNSLLNFNQFTFKSLSIRKLSTEIEKDDNNQKKLIEDDEELSYRGRELMPKEVVGELNRYIVGQDEAKKAVAIALRNRWRRRQLLPSVRREIMPKNILLIGPTGVGKTEIARRLAHLCQAPFIKVEATKFTEVGFHGRDVDHIIRDLVEVGIQQMKKIHQKRNKIRINSEVEEKLLSLLTGEDSKPRTRESFREMLKAGELDSHEVEIDIHSTPPKFDIHSPNEFVSQILQMNKGSKKVKLTVKDAIPYLQSQMADKLVNNELITKEAIEAVEQDGIVFIDEIDKICTSKDSPRHGADASDEGVQRDLLPLIEGCIINTKYGNIDTSKILFIASGAFYACKPSDLLPELQGRLPIRVELKALSQNDLYRILTEPEMNLIKQQIELMKTEGIQVTFPDDAIKEIARFAAEINQSIENIGARRLHTVIEKIMEDISFNCDKSQPIVNVTKDLIQKQLKPMMTKQDLSKFIL